MKIHTIQDLSNRKVVNFLKKNLSQVDEQHLITNYHPDYATTPGNLFRILEEGRYKTGNYFVMEEDGKYVGSAGWNEYEGVALLFTRAYIPKPHRMRYLMANYLMPLVLEQTEDYNKLWITCNDYNIAIYKGLLRLASGRPAGISEDWPAVYNKFVPIGKKTVYYTEQYVAEYDKTK